MTMYKLYFTDSIERLMNEEFLCESESITDILKHAQTALEEHEYQSTPYWRYLAFPDGVYIDFGSWSKFLYIENARISDIMKAEDENQGE